MNKISVYIIAYNESEKIKSCLKSVLWADEIILADSHSTDGTSEIAEKMGAKVVHIDFKGYGDLRNQAIKFCSHDWILSIDADERCDSVLRDEIQALNEEKTGECAFRFRRKDYFMGRWLKRAQLYPSWFVRFFRPDKIRIYFWQFNIL